MADTSSLVFAGIAPHPPIMVPEVGREAIADVRASIEAMSDLTQRVIASGAETVVLISPHAPLESDTFVAYDGPQLYGDFAMFRAPTATVHAELNEELLNEMTRVAAEQNLAMVRIKGFDLDHGTAVPLYFLQRNGWHGRVVALGYSFLSNEDHLRFGKCIKQAIENVGCCAAFIASGDLSHRLKRGAPAGYNADAHLFDEEIVDAIRSNSTDRIVSIDQELRHLAGECGYRSMLVAIGAARGLGSRCEAISYEAPFGVGYLVAQLSAGSGDVPFSSSNTEPPVGSGSDTESSDVSSAQSGESVPPTSACGAAKLPGLARLTIETFVRTGTIITPPEQISDLLTARAGCFVCIKTKAGDLRGCIGTFEPEKDSLAEETIANAIHAATRDPRFPPVREDELSGLKFSVDVLSAPEPCRAEHLDPHVYGVIVEDQNGIHRGLLLPNLEGIDTPAQQIEIASRKAGIAPGAAVKFFRFRADRYSE
jgi:AmmeMemoRadiSam system protein A/AmmeMemoRadiSam system protein B